MINWKFEGYDVNFVSTPENHAKHIYSMSKALKIKPDTKIIYTNGNIDKPILADVTSIPSDTSNVSQSTIPMGTKKGSSTKSKTYELPTMPSDVDNADSEFNDLDLFDTSNDIERSGDFNANEPNG